MDRTYEDGVYYSDKEWRNRIEAVKAELEELVKDAISDDRWEYMSGVDDAYSIINKHCGGDAGE